MLVARVIAAAALLAGAAAHAQTYPAKPVRMLSQFPAGGPVDTLTRQIGAEFTRDLGQPFLIENRPGANGIISTEACAKSAPDGYTLCLVDRSIPLLPFLYSKLPFDIVKDFEPATNLFFTILGLVGNPSMGAANLNEFIAAARSKPGAFNYGSLGPGTLANLLMEWLKKQHGINVTHVPYKGPPQLIQAVVANEVQLTYLGVGAFVPFHKAGKLRILGVSGERRSPLVPDVPTLIEQGLTGMDARVWFGWFVPAGTPRDAVDRVHREVVRIFSSAAFVEKNLTAQAFEPIASAPDDFARFLKADRESGAELIRISGAKLE
jgi:tripartite-type tricarboxylate transporter receptor subunit TctC